MGDGLGWRWRGGSGCAVFIKGVLVLIFVRQDLWSIWAGVDLMAGIAALILGDMLLIDGGYT